MCCVKFSSFLPPAADDLWSMSDIYCNNLPIVTMLTPRKTAAVNTKTGLVPEPDAVDLLPIDRNVKRYSIGQQFTKPANITNAQYQLFVSRPVLGCSSEHPIPVLKYILELSQFQFQCHT